MRRVKSQRRTFVDLGDEVAVGHAECLVGAEVLANSLQMAAGHR